jgi:hypothetical protein
MRLNFDVLGVVGKLENETHFSKVQKDLYIFFLWGAQIINN